MPSKRGSKKGRGGRGGRGSHHLPNAEPDFGDDFIAFDTLARGGHRGRGHGRGASAQLSSVFVPPATRPAHRGGFRGSGPSTPARGQDFPASRGRGDFKPRGRGTPSIRGHTRGSTTPRGRGRGFGYTYQTFGGSIEYQSRLLEPIRFVSAEVTPRVLFEDAEEIFKPEVVDLAQGDGVPTANIIEAAFAIQQRGHRGSEEDTAQDESDFPQGINTQRERTPQPDFPITSHASAKEVPKLDIASAVSLATALKDAALTPREENLRPITPMMHGTTANRNDAAPVLITPIMEPDSESESDSEDVVLFAPQPRTPARSLTPLPLLGVPGPTHMFGSAHSPMRPSLLSLSFGPPVREEDESRLDTIMETSRQTPLESEERTAGNVTPKKPKHSPVPTPSPRPEAEVPIVKFEDFSSVVFVDTTPAPVELASHGNGTHQAHPLGMKKPQRTSTPSNDLRYHETHRSSSLATKTTPTSHSGEVDKKPTATNSAQPTGSAMPSKELALASTRLGDSEVGPRPPTPNFHAMTFKFTPRSDASRARRPPPSYYGHRGLGFKRPSKTLIPREGDSDLDWGDEGPPKLRGQRKAKKAASGDTDENDESGDDPGMAEDVTPAEMLSFLQSAESREWVTMDDIKDRELLIREDEDDLLEEVDSEDDSEDSSEPEDEIEEELKKVILEAEKELIGSDDDDISHLPEDDDDSDDVDGSFSTRLKRMRQSAARQGPKGKKGKKGKKRGKGKGKGRDYEDDSSDIQLSGFSWADKDEDAIAAMQEQLEEALFLKRERKRGVISPPLSPASLRKKQDLPPDLLVQWERDRQKKAENKRRRALQRQIAAMEQPKRGSGSKVAFLFNTSNPLPTLAAIESRMRSFVANLNMHTMALPAMDKECRRRAHLLAECFQIKTASKGSGSGRYVTLIRTSRTGVMINEAKVRKLVRADEEAEGGGIAAFNRAYYGRDSNGQAGKSSIKTRDGEIVGRTAAKIGEDNVGHRLLSKMGWTEGDIIGKSGGITDPLLAVMKRSKLGLGATYK